MYAGRKKKVICYTLASFILLALIIWISLENTALEQNTYIVASQSIPAAFDGFRIAHVSDLHNAEMGDDNADLLELLRKMDPDIIAITGDLVDSRNTNIEVALQFTEQAVQIAPCYYVTGNHEARIEEYDELRKGLSELGVIVMEDEQIEIKKSGEAIILLGVNDPSFQTDYLFGDAGAIIDYTLQNLTISEDTYRILLSHRPELFDIYIKNSINLVLSGHAHGGQFRFPFIGGLFAPNQGFFPQYDAGIYTFEETNMIVSRGIGNSIIPFRINNRPEVILIELSTQHT